jgi:hypothetical protein
VAKRHVSLSLPMQPTGDAIWQEQEILCYNGADVRDALT